MKLDYLSSHFADTAKQISKFSAREVLGISLVDSDLVDNLKSPSLCAVSYPRRFLELPLTTCRLADMVLHFAVNLA